MNESSSLLNRGRVSTDEASVDDCINSNEENFDKLELHIDNTYKHLKNGDVQAALNELDAIKETFTLLKEGHERVTLKYRNNTDAIEARAYRSLDAKIDDLGLRRVFDLEREFQNLEYEYDELQDRAIHNESLLESSEAEMKKLKQEHKEELDEKMSKKDDLFHDVANRNIDLNGLVHDLRHQLSLAEEVIEDLELQIPDHPPQSDDDMDE